MQGVRALILDNYDSFTFNIKHLLSRICIQEPIVIAHDKISVQEIASLFVNGDIHCIILSPGPGNPTDLDENVVGVCARVLQFLQCIPIFGICLGHQAIGLCHGARLVKAKHLFHGRRSIIKILTSRENDLFNNCGTGKSEINDDIYMSVVRYHSWTLLRESIPLSDFYINAWVNGDESSVMAISHKRLPRHGVQFHPESICSDVGTKLLTNFVCMASTYLEKNGGYALQNIACIFQNNIASEISWRESTNVFRKVTNHNTSESVDLQWFRIEDLEFSSEEVFINLFSLDKHAWWLDSSSVPNNLSSFSFMGGIGGPQWKYLSFTVSPTESKNGSLVIEDKCGTQSLECDLWHYLSENLLEFRSSSKKYEQVFLESRGNKLSHYIEEVHSNDVPFPFLSGFVGAFGYEMKSSCFSQVHNLHESEYPDSLFYFTDRYVVLDHRSNELFLVSLSKSNEDKNENLLWMKGLYKSLVSAQTVSAIEPIPRIDIQSVTSCSRDYYICAVNQCLCEIANGNSYEICLTDSTSVNFEVSDTPVVEKEYALNFYLNLRKRNPSPYSAFLTFPNNLTIACSSPECFLKVSGGWVEAKPIKGTVPRGSCEQSDRKLMKELFESEKNRAENMMIVDLLRNDIGRACEKGTIHVPKARLMDVESYATVHQLVTTVRGKLVLLFDTQSHPTIECIKNCFPGGSMTGAPKLRTMEIIDSVERSSRGMYSGSLGYISLNGSCDLNIIIRSAIFCERLVAQIAQHRNVMIGSGGAITALSHPGDEYEEMLLKVSVFKNMFEEANERE